MMSIKFVAVILAFAFVLALVAGEEEEFKCLGQKINTHTEEEIKAYEKCGGELNINENSIKENPDVLRCLTTCVYKKLGVMTSDDKLDVAVLGKSIDAVFPEKARAGIKADIKKCADETTKKLTNDDNCKNHLDYQNCVVNAYVKNCSG